MEEWEENKIDSFKSCVKLKKHTGCYLGSTVLLFWGFSILGNFLEIQMENPSFIHSLFFSSFLFPLFCFFDCCVTSKYLWVWEGFFALSNIGGSFCFFKYLCYILKCCMWIYLGTWCSVIFFINKMPGVLVLFLATYMVI